MREPRSASAGPDSRPAHQAAAPRQPSALRPRRKKYKDAPFEPIRKVKDDWAEAYGFGEADPATLAPQQQRRRVTKQARYGLDAPASVTTAEARSVALALMEALGPLASTTCGAVDYGVGETEIVGTTSYSAETQLTPLEVPPGKVGSKTARTARAGSGVHAQAECLGGERVDGSGPTSEVIGGVGGDADNESNPNLNRELKQRMKPFRAKLSSFQDLINADHTPVSLAETLESLERLVSEPSFTWEKPSGFSTAYGKRLTLVSQLVLWYHNADIPDTKTRASTTVTFMYQPGCAYIYQPIVPVTAVMGKPRHAFKPMFEMDPRTFHSFKLAWKDFKDFKPEDYQLVVGDKLEMWTKRCKDLSEKPISCVYWIMLMVGSYYRETLVARKTIPRLESRPDRVPVIRLDSFASLSAVLFSPERQVLFAGVDPPLAYLHWLQYIGDQHRSCRTKKSCCTVVEANEYLDCAVIIVYYGRILQKVKESDWVAMPDVIHTFIGKYADDNLCVSQIESAVRLYTYTCSLGKVPGKDFEEESWVTWNGMNICEVGVPMPSTQATIFAPFLSALPVAMQCSEHGWDLDKRKRFTARSGLRMARSSSGDTDMTKSSCGDLSEEEEDADSSHVEEDDETKASQAEDTASSCSSPGAQSPTDGGDQEGRAQRGGACLCTRYLRSFDELRMEQEKKQNRNQAGPKPEVEQALRAVGDYDVVHSFAALLAGALNLAKRVMRLHFSIDPEAYKNLPPGPRAAWQDTVMPWYRDFHRPDGHGRSRYSFLIASCVNGLMGPGFVSGVHEEAFDILRVPAVSPTPLAGSSTVRSRRASFASTKEPLKDLRASTRTAATDIALWALLYETESLVSHREHVERFTQFCHSAHLVPFLHRCYRRSGIAGLLINQRSGHHKYGLDPTYPLVLPSVQNFCYGHCYPFSRVLEYFYGGLDTLVCSWDDPNVVEGLRGQLGFINGQERFNGNAWFHIVETFQAKTPIHLLTETQLRQFREHSPSEAPILKVNSLSLEAQSLVAGGCLLSLNRAFVKARASRQTVMSSANASVGGGSKGCGGRPPYAASGASTTSKPQQPEKRPLPRRKLPSVPALGVMSPEDPFLWFTQQKTTLYTYPASDLPRALLKPSRASLAVRYSDFVSRNGSPEPRTAQDEEEKIQFVPPSTNLRQPTEPTDHVRQRWQVTKEFVDDQNMLLGDFSWFPGALGYRFTFEATTDSVERYFGMGSVPQAQLLYLETVRGRKEQRSAVPKGQHHRDATDDLVRTPERPNLGHDASELNC